MFEMLQLLAETNLFLLIFSVLIFDVPRYTLSLLSLALFGAWRRSDRVPAGNAAVSVIIPTFNAAPGSDPRSRHYTDRPYDRSKSLSSMTAQPTKRGPSRSRRARAA